MGPDISNALRGPRDWRALGLRTSRGVCGFLACLKIPAESIPARVWSTAWEAALIPCSRLSQFIVHRQKWECDTGHPGLDRVQHWIEH